jgi:hypothetical protein
VGGRPAGRCATAEPRTARGTWRSTATGTAKHTAASTAGTASAGSGEGGVLFLTRAFGTTPSASRCTAAEEIFFLLLFLFVAFGNYGRIGIRFFVIVGVFSAIPEAITVVLIDRPAAILIIVIVVGSLAATEATEIVRVVVVRKTQWLHWFTARH